MRLFVALEIPPGVRTGLARWATGAVGTDDVLRRVAADALHLTLAFLGERPEDEAAQVGEAVRAAARVRPERIVLTLGGALWLAPRRPHVLTVALDDGDGRLAALHAELWTALAGLGIEPERRAFRPHVTVARVRHGARVRPRELPAPPPETFTAGPLTLFRSHLGGGRPARYEPLVQAPLGS